MKHYTNYSMFLAGVKNTKPTQDFTPEQQQLIERACEGMTPLEAYEYGERLTKQEAIALTAEQQYWVTDIVDEETGESILTAEEKRELLKINQETALIAIKLNHVEFLSNVREFISQPMITKAEKLARSKFAHAYLHDLEDVEEERFL